jgi:hypothetical protein
MTIQSAYILGLFGITLNVDQLNILQKKVEITNVISVCMMIPVTLGAHVFCQTLFCASVRVFQMKLTFKVI